MGSAGGIVLVGRDKRRLADHLVRGTSALSYRELALSIAMLGRRGHAVNCWTNDGRWSHLTVSILLAPPAAVSILTAGLPDIPATPASRPP